MKYHTTKVPTVMQFTQNQTLVCVEVHTLPHIPRVEGGRRVCMFIENRDTVWFEV